MMDRLIPTISSRGSSKHVFTSTMKMSGRIMMDLSWTNLHTLCHTFGSVKLEHGENLTHVSRQLGRAKASITADAYACSGRYRARTYDLSGVNRMLFQLS